MSKKCYTLHEFARLLSLKLHLVHQIRTFPIAETPIAHPIRSWTYLPVFRLRDCVDINVLSFVITEATVESNRDLCLTLACYVSLWTRFSRRKFVDSLFNCTSLHCLYLISTTVGKLQWTRYLPPPITRDLLFNLLFNIWRNIQRVRGSIPDIHRIFFSK